ncbi:NEAT domain-containing protein [Lysinibacillus sp. CD3-6]|uniref:NEAT domain-containing protein n=1 Tax=Lysinibacillus sp. CD3-6 TaxID=2892541 RepID=UPI00116D6A93|nr:NEAT domain-containing protein [Lysinibacillus sp. CD3-6]UED81695.1 NEAT domain-containing protein [Lysinibacillus sp. CD3-6]
MKKFIQYVAMTLLIFGAVLPYFGMEVKAAENTEASCTIDYSASFNVLKEDKSEDSVMIKSGYVKKEATLQKENGQYTVDITVPGQFSTWYRGFKVESGGELKEAIKKEKDSEENEVYTFAIDQHDDPIRAWVDIYVKLEQPVPFLYDNRYTVYLVLSNVKETNRVCKEAPKQPETLEQNKDNEKGNTNGSESGSGENNNTTANFKQEGVVQFEFPQHEREITTFLQTSNTVFEDNKYKVTLSLNTQNKLQEFTVKQNEKEIAKWSNKVASVVPVAMPNTATLSFEADTLDNLVFEAVTTDKLISANVTATVRDEASASKKNNNTTVPVTGDVTGGSTQSTNGLYTVDYTFIKGLGSGTSMMDQYVIKPAYVVKSGSSYQVQLTLKNSSWITGFTVNGSTPTTISDANDVRVVQFTLPNLADRYDAWVKVDIEDIKYHHNYNIYLQFNEGSLSKISDSSTFPITSGPIDTPPMNKDLPKKETKIDQAVGNFIQEGAVKFEIQQNAKELMAFLQKANTVFEDNKYKVTLTLNTGNNLQQFIVKQNGKEIAKWSNKAASRVLIVNDKTATLSFEMETLDNLVFEAVTANKTITSNVTATKTMTNEKITRQPITYKMEADPNGKIPDFITNYLAPYFTKAELVTIDDKRYIEMTLIGKAYGFETLAYIDAEGKQQDIEIISSKGEKLDQVRVVRLPLVQDKNGVTKIFVDSGSLGYGAYTLFFTFNVPALEEEATIIEEDTNIVNSTIVENPFTDIDNVFSKDEILALYAAGITTGTSATTFSPNRNITRAQFAVMIARALNISSNKETAFTDVKGKWYEKEVQALAEIGIVKGVNATTFNPNANITRQQAAAIILRMLEYKGYKVTVDKNALTYKDANKVFDYAKQAVSELQALDIMTGSNGYLNPQSNLTRAQMAKILKRSLELVNLI